MVASPKPVGHNRRYGRLRMRLLIVEDEEKMARAVRAALESEGYEAAIAESGEEGYFLATTEEFDLVLLDWLLPARDGIEVLHKMREHGVTLGGQSLGNHEPLAQTCIPETPPPSQS